MTMERTFSAATEDLARREFKETASRLWDEGWEPSGESLRKEDRRMRQDLYHLTVTFMRRAEPGPVTAPADDDLPGVPFSEGEMAVRVTTAAEAKLAIKELKLKKKEYAIQKKQVAAEIAAIRAAHRSRTAQRGTKVRGGGGAGRFVRGIQTAQRDNDRANTDRQIQGYERQKMAIETAMTELDRAILQLEGHALRST